MSYGRCFLHVALKISSHGGKTIHASFLGYRISFFDARTFISLLSEIFFRREYEFDAMRVDPYIIDCGSNIGMSVLYFKYCYPRARIIAFEPDPQTYRVLVENVAQNGLSDVALYNLALADREGTVSLHRDPSHAGSLTMSVVGPHALKEPLEKVDVRTAPLSTFITGNETVDFLKIDIEGSEGLVLAELERSGAINSVREMIIEYHGDPARPENSLASLLKILEHGGFHTLVRSAHKRPPYARYKHKHYTLLVQAYR